jgi:hypothetical protein
VKLTDTRHIETLPWGATKEKESKAHFRAVSQKPAQGEDFADCADSPVEFAGFADNAGRKDHQGME